MTRLSRRASLAMAAAAVTGLAGCNSSNSDDTTTDVGERSATSATETPTEMVEPTATPTEPPVAPDAALSAKTPALQDADPRIVVDGLEPGTVVTLTAKRPATDAFQPWQAQATFEADEKGVVRVSKQAPVEGSYEGIQPGGLIWSMRPVRDVPPKKASFPFEGDKYHVVVTATVEGQQIAETTLVRRFVAPDVTTRTVGAADVVGTFAVPPGDEPRPGIIVLHGSGGSPQNGYAKMFASHGFPTLAIKYFGQDAPIPDDLVEVPLSYFDRAAEWLRSQPSVSDGDLGVYGVSKGGEGALFLAAHADWAGAVVGEASSGVAFQGMTANWRWADGSSWAIDGDPVPYISGEDCYAETTDEGLTRIAAGYECALSKADEKTITEATFPVENFDGPIFCFSGKQDAMWPASRLSEFAVDRLREHDAADRIEHQSYEKMGHTIPIPYFPTYGGSKHGTILYGGTPAGIAKAATDAWPRTLQTFEEGLN